MRIAVVIPSFRVKRHILGVIESIGHEVEKIFVVDDACPEQSGAFVQEKCRDPRVEVIRMGKNEGVGGATVRGFLEASRQGFEILVKLDGDGQMDPKFIPVLCRPIQEGRADYTKGNRFYSPRSLSKMPAIRLLGNAGLSFLAKLTSGYWHVMDPTNGFVAIHSQVFRSLEINRLSKRYFFENDMLFRLGLVRAAVIDVPMIARYGDESSSLSVWNSFFSFPLRFFVRILKRIFYRYFVRDFNAGSVLLLSGFFLFHTGVIFGLYHWWRSIHTGQIASSGTVMLAALPTLLGFQLLVFALLYDVITTPKDAIYSLLEEPFGGAPLSRKS